MTNDISERALLEILTILADAGYRFTPPTPETHGRVNARPENAVARDLQGVFGWNRPFAPAAVGPDLWRLLNLANAVERVEGGWKATLRVAALDDRLYLHSAFPTTRPDSVFFGPDTYRFVRSALAALPRRRYGRAVDIGCGSGAGGLSIAARLEIEELVLTDVNPAALSFARINAAFAGRIAERRHSDLFADLDGAFDLILANPPYLVDPVHRAYRDGGGDRGMDLGLRIVREGSERLAAGGILFLYTGVPIVGGGDIFWERLEQIRRDDRFVATYETIDPDVFGEELETPAYRDVDRIAAVGLMITRRRTQL